MSPNQWEAFVYIILKALFQLQIAWFPDIFQDRCEILESNTRMVKRKPTQKSYWNIFTEWKFNLKETSPSLSEWEVLERKKNALNAVKKTCVGDELEQEDYFGDFRNVFEAESCRKPRSIAKRGDDELEQEDYFSDFRSAFNAEKRHRPRRIAKCEDDELEQEDYFSDFRSFFNAENCHRPRSIAKHEDDRLEQEDYFSDFRSVFDAENRHRRRSIAELEDDELIIESPMKKIKQDMAPKKKMSEGKSMAYKFGRAYQGMRRNLAISLGYGKMKDNFDFWSSESTIESLIEVICIFYLYRQRRLIVTEWPFNPHHHCWQHFFAIKLAFIVQPLLNAARIFPKDLVLCHK